MATGLYVPRHSRWEIVARDNSGTAAAYALDRDFLERRIEVAELEA